MGSNASKAAQSATRKFPTRAPGAAVPPSARPAAPPAGARRSPPSAGTPPPASRASPTKDESIRADSMDPMADPAFSARLRQMGIATPNPTLSNSSTATPVAPRPRPPPPPSAASAHDHQQLDVAVDHHQQQRPMYPAPSQNQTLTALEARRRLEEAVEWQLEDPSGLRAYADVGTLRQALVLRRRGTPAADIERRLRLQRGVLAEIESGGAIAPFTI